MGGANFIVCPRKQTYITVGQDKTSKVFQKIVLLGMRHRDHAVTGNILKSMSSGLANYFFGANLTEKLTVEKFLDFQKQLMTEVLQLEFNRYEPTNGKINERDFADSIIIYAGHNFNKRSKMLKKVKRNFAGGTVS
ncbi:hypothetical protein HELRODRAFT_69923 [Helobdella robusta]|uniref:Uncharacterized protein n=1 Tax=Helobdella robusta TaxID=6412 RepID=T1FZZ8_HELRO|nr:hypothetical protein HELRODRAFT_69923 [Helobdella robusta]ESN92592.1 hypothetical protein HELRODRAFT_69923 [Helobdella robusta]